MSTTMSFVAEKPFVKAVERAIARTGIYQSKSEFLRDAARQRMVQLLGVETALKQRQEVVKRLGIETELKRVQKSTEKLRKKVKFYRPLTRKEREEIAERYLREISQQTRQESGRAGSAARR